MRVVAGKYSGKRLYSSKGRKTRPTTDRAKETLFNLLENSIKINFKDQNVLDIFAGSGALGIESLSRGANFCTFIDIKVQKSTKSHNCLMIFNIENERQFICLTPKSIFSFNF